MLTMSVTCLSVSLESLATSVLAAVLIGFWLGRRPRVDCSLSGPTEVLRGSLKLLWSLWSQRSKRRPVVVYLSPQETMDQLFSLDGALSLTLDAPLSEPTRFLQLLALLQRYSVDTSHAYFFNQLFGALDPIALAAEIVALSVNTSVYTYETAPVFTMLERELMGHIGKLVFHTDHFQGEGLMIPGGSLANLTAMHAARHRWKVIHGYTDTQQQQIDTQIWNNCNPEDIQEEKKCDLSTHAPPDVLSQDTIEVQKQQIPHLVAFVSTEAHYSFAKSARILGMREEDLIVISTLPDGTMNVKELQSKIYELEMQDDRHPRVPFFVACTAGSTVRGSFDNIAEIVHICRNYELRQPTTSGTTQRTLWVHVDGAWGGSAIFSTSPQLRSITHMDDICLADSFTFNPHKMLGAPQQTTAFIVRHRHALKTSNAGGAGYLFDSRKNGAEYDLGDLSYTCGRRTDAVKLWALWKYYGREGLGDRVDQKVEELRMFVAELRKRPSFALACQPWPFNVNFFYFPPRIREVLEARGVLGGARLKDGFAEVPEDIALDLANVSVALKLRLHEAGEMIIPYQPLSNQKADCFRLVLAGNKKFDMQDICHVLDTMERYGVDL